MTKRQVNLSRIRPEHRAEAWRRLQEKHPALADLVQDPFVQAIRAAFNAEIVIEIPEIDE